MLKRKEKSLVGFDSICIRTQVSTFVQERGLLLYLFPPLNFTESLDFCLWVFLFNLYWSVVLKARGYFVFDL